MLETVEAIAVYVGLIVDVIFLLILIVILAALLLIYRKVSATIGSVQQIVKTTEEMVSSVQENLVRPASQGSSVAFGLGKVAAFMRGRKKQE